MTDNDQPYAKSLAEKLAGLSKQLEDDKQHDQKELLTAILAVAHGLKDAAATNGNGTSKLVLGFKDAFDPLPAENIQMILNYKSDDGSSISYKRPVENKDTPES